MSSEILLLLECIARVTGSLSIIGSLAIIYMIISDRKRKLAQPFHRLMLLMSIFDVLHSIAIVVSTAAKTSMRLCDTQGFFMVLGLAVPLYNSCLNIFFVLTIRYNVSSEQFSKGTELVLHAIAILIPITTATVFTARGLIIPNYTGICHVSGSMALWIIQSILLLCFVICVASMVCICWTVITQAMKMEKYTSFATKKTASLRSHRVNDDKKKTIKQALLYTMAFILTYLFPILCIFYKTQNKEVPLPLIILYNIFYPLQGFWNFVFYVRPGVQLVMQRSPENSYLRTILVVILDPESTVSRRRRSAFRKRRRRSSILRSTNRTKITAATEPKTSLVENNDSCVKEIYTSGTVDWTNSNEDYEVEMEAQTQQDAKSAEADMIQEDNKQGKEPLQPRIKPRRLSLVHLSSILCEEEIKYLDDC